MAPRVHFRNRALQLYMTASTPLHLQQIKPSASSTITAALLQPGSVIPSLKARDNMVPIQPQTGSGTNSNPTGNTKPKQDVAFKLDNRAQITSISGAGKTTSAPGEKALSHGVASTGKMKKRERLQGRPETSDVVARRMIGRAMAVKLPEKEDEKTATVTRAIKLEGRGDRVACWENFKRVQGS